MNVPNTIRDLLTNSKGDYWRGMKHIITAPQVCNAAGIPVTKETTAYVQCEINRILNDIEQETGYITGGIDRTPRKYMIAETLFEEKLILFGCSPQLQSRIRKYIRRGQNVLTTSEHKRITSAQNAVDKIAEALDPNPPLIETS